MEGIELGMPFDSKPASWWKRYHKATGKVDGGGKLDF